MKTVSIFKHGEHQAINLPKDMEFSNIDELEIIKAGDSIILRPVKPSWSSFVECDVADSNFLEQREMVINELEATQKVGLFE